MLPDLERLEKEFARELVIVGVHSGKFPMEKTADGLRAAIERLGITHPNVNDPEYAIWEAYGARAWPTLVTIDTDGQIVDRFSGEGKGDRLRGAIEGAIADGEKAGTLKRGAFETSAAGGETGVLRYPGKIAAGRGLLYISDTGHHRIVVAKPDGAIVETIGSGERGFADGAYADAKFDSPQGLCVDGDTLYVADTENHRIRAVDLGARRVSTIAGTGEQKYRRDNDAAPLETPLNSPWDVAARGDELYIAMAGNHQIWRLAGGALGAYAGTGREHIRDGDVATAWFSQPSGLAVDGDVLWVADAEDSAIRRVDLAAGRVRTVVGTGLFDFGDEDGRGRAAKLQHPLAVAVLGGALVVADSYNHKIKRIDPKTEEVTTAFEGFAEPGGLAVLDGRLYVADTNAHAIKVCGEGVETLELRR